MHRLRIHFLFIYLENRILKGSSASGYIKNGRNDQMCRKCILYKTKDKALNLQLKKTIDLELLKSQRNCLL